MHMKISWNPLSLTEQPYSGFQTVDTETSKKTLLFVSMAIRRGRKLLPFLMILMAILSPLFPLLQASSFNVQGERLGKIMEIKGGRFLKVIEVEINGAETNFQKGVSSSIGEESSARQVPTGADPLHHNQVPNGP